MNYWQTDLVRLRGLEPEDAALFHEMNQDTEMGRLLDQLWPPSSLAGTKSWVEGRIKRGHENDEIYCVIESGNGDFVGTLNSHNIDRRVGCFQYGLTILEEHRRKGYASEAVKLFLRYFFEELRYQKVTVEVYSFNEPSIQFHERFGFQLEGRLRRTLYTNGRFHDQLFYGLIVEEFQEKYS